MDTTSKMNVGSNKVGPVGQRAATKDNTEFTDLFTRVPSGVRFLVASFRPGFAFLAHPS